jgi:hypothetical protein
MQRNVHTPLTDEYLQALGDIRPAELPPFFLTRLQARMARERLPARWRWQPALALGALALALVLNTVALLQQQRQPQKATQQGGAFENFASDFDLYSTSNY